MGLEETKAQQSGAEEKIEEYASRIRAGEDASKVKEGLGASWQQAIDERLVVLKLDSDRREFLDRENSDFLRNSRAMRVDETPEQFREERKRAWQQEERTWLIRWQENQRVDDMQGEVDKRIDSKLEDGTRIQGIKQQLGIKEETASPDTLEQRKKFKEAPAAYELAKIAEQDGIDLTKLSREEYAQYAIKNYFAIGDNELRMSPVQRTATSVEDHLKMRKGLRAQLKPESEQKFHAFSHEMKTKSEGQDRNIRDGVRIRSGTQRSDSWLFFAINQGASAERVETHKSYISLRDVNNLSPERFVDFMSALKDAGYNGDIKIFQDMELQGTVLGDQVVMHGATEADAQLALRTAESFFDADLDQKSMGKDETIDGKHLSYSQVLAKRISDTIAS